MHEMALAHGIVEVIREQAAAQAFRRVLSVRLVIGALSHVEPEALAFGFDAASRGSPAEGAALRIDRPPGEAFCLDCETTVEIGDRAAACPACGGYRLMVTGGEDMRIKDLEVE